jgi:hypothetical protein
VEGQRPRSRKLDAAALRSPWAVGVCAAPRTRRPKRLVIPAAKATPFVEPTRRQVRLRIPRRVQREFAERQIGGSMYAADAAVRGIVRRDRGRVLCPLIRQTFPLPFVVAE